MRLLENLEKIRGVLSDESKWTKEVYARDEDNIAVSFMSGDACSWCLMGAIYKTISTIKERNDVINCLSGFLLESHSIDIIKYNDETSYEDVTNLLDKAIADVS